jgi:hypothetical protein
MPAMKKKVFFTVCTPWSINTIQRLVVEAADGHDFEAILIRRSVEQ